MHFWKKRMNEEWKKNEWKEWASTSLSKTLPFNVSINQYNEKAANCGEQKSLERMCTVGEVLSDMAQPWEPMPQIYGESEKFTLTSGLGTPFSGMIMKLTVGTSARVYKWVYKWLTSVYRDQHLQLPPAACLAPETSQIQRPPTKTSLLSLCWDSELLQK